LPFGGAFEEIDAEMGRLSAVSAGLSRKPKEPISLYSVPAISVAGAASYWTSQLPIRSMRLNGGGYQRWIQIRERDGCQPPLCRTNPTSRSQSRNRGAGSSSPTTSPAGSC